MLWVFQHAKARLLSHQNTHAHTYCSHSWQLCVCVCERLCRLSATDRFIVAEQQHLVLHSLKESVFSPVEFNQSGGGHLSKLHLPSHIYRYTVQFLEYTKSLHSYLFFFLIIINQNRHTTAVKKKQLYTWVRQREQLKGYHVYLTLFESAVGRVNLYSL